MFVLARKRKNVDDADTITESTSHSTAATPKKRGRKANIVEATKSASPQAKRLSVQKEPADEEKMEVDANGSNGGNGVPEKSDQLFDGCYFMLTSSARRPNGLF